MQKNRAAEYGEKGKKLENMFEKNMRLERERIEAEEATRKGPSARAKAYMAPAKEKEVITSGTGQNKDLKKYEDVQPVEEKKVE